MNDFKRDTILVGTRGSALALIQAEIVIAKLREAFPRTNFELTEIKTAGDINRNTPLAQMGGVGVFVKELENALANGRVDMAVHSAKDLPSLLSPGFTLAAVPEREAVDDALVCRGDFNLETLPEGSSVATGSVRRKALLKNLRPDLKICEVRGNVDTRLRRLREGEYDAIVLAHAGLRRLGREDTISQILSPEDYLPAPGQGAIAVEVRAGDDAVISLVRKIDNPEAHASLLAERRMLRTLNAGCASAVGAYCRWEEGILRMTAGVLDLEGKDFLRAEGECGSIDVSGHKMDNGSQ